MELSGPRKELYGPQIKLDRPQMELVGPQIQLGAATQKLPSYFFALKLFLTYISLRNSAFCTVLAPCQFEVLNQKKMAFCASYEHFVLVLAPCARLLLFITIIRLRNGAFYKILAPLQVKV